MSDLPIVSLGDLVKVKGGKRLPKGGNLQTIPNDHPYIRVRDMGQRYIPDIGLEYVPDEVFPKIQRYIVEENDVIISIVGTIGLVSVIDERFNLASQTENCAKLSGLDRNDALYVYYYLSSNIGQQSIKEATVGAVQAKLPLYNIEKIPVIWPERKERELIVNNLSSLDDKIELNRQINQTLEQIAQAIFKSWFVDFEPVKAIIEAKQNGQDPERAAMRAISGKTDEELDQLSPEQRQQLIATAALFPDDFEDNAQGGARAGKGRMPGTASVLGEIPKGWGIKRLSQMIELIGGGTPKRSEESYWHGNIPWFSVKDAPADGDVFVIGTEEKITELGLNKSSTKLLPEGVTIISARGTVGRLALVGVPMAMNQSCYGIKGADYFGLAFNYFNLKRTITTLKQQTHGAVFDTITTKTFDSVYAVSPCEKSVKEFEHIVAPLLEKIKINLFENDSLNGCRDSLLPKLLSGEITLGGTQPSVEAVAC